MMGADIQWLCRVCIYIWDNKVADVVTDNEDIKTSNKYSTDHIKHIDHAKTINSVWHQIHSLPETKAAFFFRCGSW